MDEKLKLICPVVVEGKYDKAKVCSVVSTPVMTLDGFSVFNDREKKFLLKKISEKDGIILFTDSDRAGTFIRRKLKGILADCKIYNVFAPCIKGKEKRKPKPSADGLLGVEGIDSKTIRKILMPFASEQTDKNAFINKTRFYEDGFSGQKNSLEKRKKLCEILGFPPSLTANALIEAINLLITEKEYEQAVSDIDRMQE